MRPARCRGALFPPTVARSTARLALHHLLDEALTGMGDAREEIEPSIGGDMRPGAHDDIVENVHLDNKNMEE